MKEIKMGKMQSKHACKRRESPEGGAFKEAVDCIGEVDRNGDKQDLRGKDPKEDQLSDYCALEVTLPHEGEMENRKSFHSSAENGGQHALKDAQRRGEKNDVKCNVSLMDENYQEWMITLYDFDNNGKVTRENMLSLMHTIYEVVDASVKKLVLSNGTTLRVKMSVTPSTRSNRKDQNIKTFPNERDQMEDRIRCADSHPSQVRLSTGHVGVPERKHYSVDENTERRNHYLDLAGIENYTSQFEAEPSAEDHHQDQPTRGHHRCSQIETYSPVETSRRSVSFLRSLRSRSKSIGGSGGTVRPGKLHGHQPVTWCHPSQQQPQLYSTSKRVRARARETTAPSRGLDRELQAGQAVPPGFMPVPQRHEHQHHHEHHHHHHHHHHYHPA